MSMDTLAEDRGHRRIRCRDCGYVGWSEDTGGCPRCAEWEARLGMDEDGEMEEEDA